MKVNAIYTYLSELYYLIS